MVSVVSVRSNPYGLLIWSNIGITSVVIGVTSSTKTPAFSWKRAIRCVHRVCCFERPTTRRLQASCKGIHMVHRDSIGSPGHNLSVAELLCAIETPLVLFGESTVVHHANPAFYQMLAACDWLWIEKRRLKCSHAGVAELDQIVRKMISGQRTHASMVLKGADKRQALVIGFTALEGHREVLGNFVDPFRTRCPKASALRALYGLTENESQVTAMIASGLDYKQIADFRGVSIETIRSYSKAIFKKLGVNSRASVVSAVQSATLPLSACA